MQFAQPWVWEESKGQLKSQFCDWSTFVFVLQGFDEHVKKDHNMWTYIYYSIYLDTIDTSDHNAIEKFVYEMVRSVCL